MHQEHYQQEVHATCHAPCHSICALHVPRQSDEMFLRALAAAKRELDPCMIMNPGVLLSERFLAEFERERPVAAPAIVKHLRSKL